MTKIVFNLPDTLAKEAGKAGLLTTEAIERLLRKQLRKQAVDQLFDSMDRMAAVPEPKPMTPEELAEDSR